MEKAARAAPEESELKEKLEERHAVLGKAISHMQRDSSPSDPQNWWSPPRDPRLALNSSVLTFIERIESRANIFTDSRQGSNARVDY